MTLPYFQVDTRNERLKTLLNKHSSIWKEFRPKLDLSWIFHDYGLEGIVLQYQEITVALNDKVASDSKFFPMYQDIKNFDEVVKHIYSLLDKSSKRRSDRYTKNLFYSCLEIMIQKLRNPPSGDGLRKEDGRYGAYYHKSCPHQEVETQLKKLLSEVNQSTSEELHPLVQAARFHYHFMKIMPYGRFSGKIARLMVNLHLMRHNYPPLVIHTVERAHYYEALASSDESALLLLMSDSMSSTVDSALAYMEDEISRRRRKREARKERVKKKSKKKDVFGKSLGRTRKESSVKSGSKKRALAKKPISKTKKTVQKSR